MPVVKPGNWCYRCGAYEHEPAGPTCTNPDWHKFDPKVFEQRVKRSEPEEVEAGNGLD